MYASVPNNNHHEIIEWPAMSIHIIWCHPTNCIFLTRHFLVL